MKIIFVRHGNPNYALDCLTELGHIQAAAAAERLCAEKIDRIYSSSCGRALETAGYTARALGLDVIPCDFIREIDWRSKDGTPILENGHPWHYAASYLSRGKCLVDPDWKEDELFIKSKTPDSFDKVAAGLDEWLLSLGYKREGYYYRVVENKYDTVAMFCHAGAFACALGHLMNLPLPFVLRSFPFDQTGIVELEMGGEVGDTVYPMFYKPNVTRHLRDKGIKVT